MRNYQFSEFNQQNLIVSRQTKFQLTKPIPQFSEKSSIIKTQFSIFKRK